MRILRQTIHFDTFNYPLEKIAPLEKILFIDIETTGFTVKSSSLYLIGAAYYEAGSWYVKQWFANTYEEEADILSAFFQHAGRYTHLIHFNGNNFDLPYLLQKCKQHHLPYHFNHFDGIDIYRRVSPYKGILKLPNCKLKTLEQYLGVGREDTFDGGELISVYHNYVKNPTDYALQALTLHNADDMKGMLRILPILSYYDLFHSPITPKKVQANYYRDINGKQHQEILMKLTLPSPLPDALSGTSKGCYFKGEGLEGTLRIPLYEEEMKYYYSNYKNYYYLPEEDTAIHKSVASFVDKNHRVQATAATCYTRKLSSYLPQWDIIFEPFFKRDYKDKETFFELTEEMKKERPLFEKYASHILNMIAQSY
ncbi:ribonuclease H-like domain-containing protein [Kineothrix sedimenti]|uniref:Ribonuclease H-like domain-containing protein n=1 Tax=Kineothrix sedimenti TaxID=3123317 RepID=A0ABZ3EQU9_9FIRM